MNRKKAQEVQEIDDLDRRIDELNDNDFQREWSKVLKSGNPEEIEEFKKHWGLGEYGIESLMEELRAEGVDVDSPVYDDGIVRFSKSNYQLVADSLLGNEKTKRKTVIRPMPNENSGGEIHINPESTKSNCQFIVNHWHDHAKRGK